jgi:hypothetical protein
MAFRPERARCDVGQPDSVFANQRWAGLSFVRDADEKQKQAANVIEDQNMGPIQVRAQRAETNLDQVD